MRYFYLLLLCTLPSVAQINFEPGYYIDNNGRKTTGLIRNVAWSRNPVFIDFKTDENAAPTEIKMAQMAEFAVGDGYLFRKFDLKYDTSQTEADALSHLRQPVWENETAMLKVLSEGKIILYGYDDHGLSRFFISKSPVETPEQLIYKQYLLTPTDIGTNNQFRQQLFIAMDGAIQKSEAEKLRYSKDEILKLFRKSNGTQQKDFSKGQNKGDFNLRVSAGAISSKMAFEEITYGTDGDFGRQVGPTVGLEAEYVLPFNQNKWSITLGAFYQSYKGDAHRTTSQSITSDYQTIESPLQIRHYFFLNDRLSIFVNAGYNLAADLSSTIDIKGLASGTVNSISIDQSSNFVAGIGVKYDRFSVEFRYHAERDILAMPYWNAQFQSMGLLASYKIL